MADSKKYYEILGVPTTATKDEINTAFRKRAMECHPDKFPEDKRAAAEAEFKKVNEAKEVLSDDNKRAAYDSEMPSFDNGFNSDYSSFDYSNPFANMGGTYDYGQKVAQNPVIYDLYQQIYSGAPGANKTLEEILKMKKGAK